MEVAGTAALVVVAVTQIDKQHPLRGLEEVMVKRGRGRNRTVTPEPGRALLRESLAKQLENYIQAAVVVVKPMEISFRLVVLEGEVTALINPMVQTQ